MAKGNNAIIFVVIAVILIALIVGPKMGLFTITGNERLTRTAPAQVDVGSTFNVVYTASSVSGSWAVTIIDTLVCPGYANQVKQTVIVSDEGITKTVSYSIPNVGGLSCNLQGNYQYGNKTLIAFTPLTITTKTTTTSHTSKACYDSDVYWYNSLNVREDKFAECGTPGCSNGVCLTCTTHASSACYSNNVYWYNSCGTLETIKETCANGCTNGACVIINTQCNTEADTNCNGVVDRTELGIYITKWINNQVTRDILGNVITAWAGSSGGSSCTGSATQSCSISNGVGQQSRTCSGSTWSSWGTCTVTSCNSGYTQSGNACIVIGGSSSGLSIVGLRSTTYGMQQEKTPTWWVGAANWVKAKFPSVPNAGIIYGVGGFNSDGNCYINFPKPSGTYSNIEFASTDQNEAYLDAYDAAGYKVWLQVEPGKADVNQLIDLVLTKYGHHPSIIGFGVDVEWLGCANDNCEGRTVTTAEATAWLNKVRTYNSNYKLFLKHWDYAYLPTSAPSGVVFIDDSEQNGNYNSFLNEFKSWSTHFSNSEVGAQVGYPSDEGFWGSYSDPVQQLCNGVASQSSNMKYCYWVDFSITDVYSG